MLTAQTDLTARTADLLPLRGLTLFTAAVAPEQPVMIPVSLERAGLVINAPVSNPFVYSTVMSAIASRESSSSSSHTTTMAELSMHDCKHLRISAYMIVCVRAL